MPNGRYRAKLKSGRVDVASKVFDTKREATAWLDRERAALQGGVDPRAGRQRTRALLEEWLELRRVTVAQKTYVSDRSALRLVPPGVLQLQVSAVSGREVARVFDRLIGQGLSESSVVRLRATLSSFFGWCVREKLIVTNPVAGVRVPRQSMEVTEMAPFTEVELDAAYEDWRTHNERLADVLLVLGWTGLRWGEARALRVGDFMEVPTPGLLVRRAAPEGVGTKATKGRRSRRVPVANRVLQIIEHLVNGRGAEDLLLVTSSGGRLHRSPVVRAVRWSETSGGRRLHDLRHTAACLWLARGVDPGTVQAWMGHESIATTNRYLHFLGTGADMAGLDRLNRDREHGSGGTRGARRSGEGECR